MDAFPSMRTEVVEPIREKLPVIVRPTFGPEGGKVALAILLAVSLSTPSEILSGCLAFWGS